MSEPASGAWSGVGVGVGEEGYMEHLMDMDMDMGNKGIEVAPRASRSPPPGTEGRRAGSGTSASGACVGGKLSSEVWRLHLGVRSHHIVVTTQTEVEPLSLCAGRSFRHATEP